MTNTIGINIKETTVKKIPLVGNKTVKIRAKTVEKNIHLVGNKTHKIRRNCVNVTFGVNKGNIGELFVANKWVKISSFN